MGFLRMVGGCGFGADGETSASLAGSSAISRHAGMSFSGPGSSTGDAETLSPPGDGSFGASCFPPEPSSSGLLEASAAASAPALSLAVRRRRRRWRKKRASTSPITPTGAQTPMAAFWPVDRPAAGFDWAGVGVGLGDGLGERLGAGLDACRSGT